MEKRHADFIFESDAAVHMGGKQSVWHIPETFLNIALFAWFIRKAELRNHTITSIYINYRRPKRK